MTRDITFTVNRASPTISGTNTLSGAAGFMGQKEATAIITSGFFGGTTPNMALSATITDGSNTATGTATATGTNVSFDFPAAQLNALNVGGPYDITVAAFTGNANNDGFAAQKIGEFTVATPAAPTISSANNYTCTAGTGGTFQVTATGNPGTFIYSLSGQPTGVSIDAGTGLITVANTVAANTYNVTVGADNGVAPAASQAFALTVEAAPAAPTITSVNNYTCTAGTGGTFQVTATGNPGTFTYSLSGQPTGVSIDAGTGLITVANTVAVNTYNFTVSADNGVNPPATQAFTLTVTDTRSLTVTAPSFDSVTAGYTRPAAKAIIIANGGTGTTAISGVTLTGANADAFEIGGSGATVAAGGSIDTWTVQPKAGLAAGSYTATISVASNGTPNPATAQVSFTVTAADHSPQNPPGKDTPINTAKDLTVTFNGEWVNVADIRLNGKSLTRAATSATQANLSGYPNFDAILGIAESGSVKVTLYKEFLQWLPNGEYKLEVEFNDGGVVSSGAAEFLIKNETASTPPASSVPPATTGGSPQTGDDSNMGLWVAVLVASLAALCAGVVLFIRQRRRRTE